MKRLSQQDNSSDIPAAMAERLRRLTRNQMGSSRVGSNPAITHYYLSISLSLQKLKLCYVFIFKLPNNFSVGPLEDSWQSFVFILKTKTSKQAKKFLVWIIHFCFDLLLGNLIKYSLTHLFSFQSCQDIQYSLLFIKNNFYKNSEPRIAKKSRTK